MYSDIFSVLVDQKRYKREIEDRFCTQVFQCWSTTQKQQQYPATAVLGEFNFSKK